MADELKFSGMSDGLPPRARKPFPEGVLIVAEHRQNPKATRWQRWFGSDMQRRYVPAKLGADGYLYGDYDAATEWT